MVLVELAVDGVMSAHELGQDGDGDWRVEHVETPYQRVHKARCKLGEFVSRALQRILRGFGSDGVEGEVVRGQYEQTEEAKEREKDGAKEEEDVGRGACG